MKSPCSPQTVGVADAVDETAVDVLLEIVEGGGVDKGMLVEYDDLLVVEFETCDPVVE